MAERQPSPGPCTLREHTRLTTLLEKIPKKAQRGLMTTVDIKLTCVDANKDFIALGANVGVVFLFNRATEMLDRLRCESYKDIVTCVKLHAGIDHQVAMGTSSGVVYLFMVPTGTHRSVKQLQQFRLDLHESRVTSLHWSTNGMKLFSGNESGAVVATEVDFYEGQSKSAEVLKEDEPIVQLDYAQRTLLISTTTRTLLCLTDNNNQVIQVGQKGRKILGHFGACYTPGITKAETFVYAARPGQRLWKADHSGQVISTYMFKDLLNAPHPELRLITYERQNPAIISEFQFQKLELLGAKYLVTWNESCLCVLDPSNNSIVGSQIRLGEVLGVAVCPDEVFVLRQGCEYNLLRLGETPEKLNNKSPYSSPMPSPVHQSRPARDTSPMHLPIQERESKNRSPFKFLQKNIFKKLHSNSDKEMGVPLGIELEISPEMEASSGAWGPEREAVPHLLEFSSQAPSSSEQAADSAVVMPRPQSISQVNTLPTAEQDLPPIVTLSAEEAPSIELYVSGAAEGVAVTQLDMTPQRQMSSTEQSGLSTNLLGNKNFDNVGTKPFITSNTSDFSNEIVFPKSKPRKNKKKGKHGKSKETEITNSPSRSSKINQSTETDSEGSKVSLTQDDGQSTSTSGEITEEVMSTDTNATTAKSEFSSKADQKADKTENEQEVKLNVSVSQREGKSDLAESSASIEQNDKDTSLSTVTSGGSDASKQYSTDASESTDAGNSQNPVSDSADLLVTADLNVTHSDVSSGSMISETTDSVVTESEVIMSSKVTGDKIKDVSDSLVHDQLHQGAIALNLHQSGRLGRTPDDIYDRYSLWHNQSSVDVLAPTTDNSNPDSSAPVQKATLSPSVPDPSTESQNSEVLPYTDMWAQFPTPGVVQSISLSTTHVWISDKDEQIYFSPLSGPGLHWTKINVPGKQIAVSQNGGILWRIHRNKAYAASKITAKKPDGTKWIEAVRDVTCIAVDNTTCWCVKGNGEVKVQVELRRDRPTHKMIDVSCDSKLRQIACLDGVIWAVTDQCQLLARSGVTDVHPYGTGWRRQHGEASGLAYWSVTLGPDQVGWAVDVLKRVWFCMNVSRERPLGDQKWWQVPMSELVTHDPTAVDKLKMFAGIFDPQRIVRELGHQQGGLIACDGTGTWLCTQQDRGLQVCRSGMIGNHWQEVHLLGMASSTCWKLLSAGNSHLSYGSVWAQQPNGELFAFPPHSFHFTKVESPSLRAYFGCLCLSGEAAWGLTVDGDVFIRTGMAPHCPLGAAWVQQDLRQIGDAHIVSISCGSQTVWAVDSEGRVFQRLGVKSASNYQLNPAWLPIPSSTPFFFTQVATGPQDYMVWALDNHRQVYARLGVTDIMPIGREWVHVPGILASELSVSQLNVWALGLSGELYCRRGIQENCLVGDYWQKIPTDGTLVKISAAANDDVWGINAEGRLFHRTTQLLPRQRRTQTNRQASLSVGSEEGEWEFL